MSRPPCIVDGCGLSREVGELCNRHRQRVAKGQPIGPACSLRDADYRFRLAYEVDGNGCWLWQRHLNHGYGMFSFEGRLRLAHRWSYERHVGPIPDGLHIDHLCRVPRCVNPDHLEPVTGAENQRRRVAAQTYCKNGHEFTPESTRLDGRGRRICLICHRAYKNAWQRNRRRELSQERRDFAATDAAPRWQDAS